MTARPRFTIVSAAFDVGRYLPEFIASLEAQDFDLSRVEVVVVDDGSTDDSKDLLEQWAARRPELVTVISQPNAGQAAARNAGIAAAGGEWVTFPDPDDVVDPGYLSTVDRFITAHPTVEMVATNRLIWTESTGTLTNTHPLNRFFNDDRLVDLEVNGSSFHGSAPAAFFRLDRIRSTGLEFDPRIRPNFEDGHFCSLYLLHCDKPVVGFLKSASYHYRKRADQSSALAGSMLHPGRYTDVFTYGYLPILRSAAQLRGEVPLWLQHFVTYELLSYLSSYEFGLLPSLSSGPEIDAFHGNMEIARELLDVDHVHPRLEAPVQLHVRYAFAHGYRDANWVDETVFIDAFDPAQRLARARYFFVGDEPGETVVNGEVETGPRHAKTRAYTYFGRTLLKERILWVHYWPDLRIAVNGAWASIQFERTATETTRVTPLRVRRHTGSPSRMDRKRVAAVSPTPETKLGRRGRALADNPRTAKRFANAWVLLDRVHNAGDSAEVVFRRLRNHHPEINAWFVIEKGTADWTRLRKEFGKRVVAHGTAEWIALMAHCINLLSSHADEPIVNPVAVREAVAANWKFTFLQHGVIKDDLSTWLNRKSIDLFVTSTRAEHASIAGDGTPYPFTTKEVQLTGLPRFDRLLEIAARYPTEERDLVLVAPTWREWLVERPLSETQRRTVGATVEESDFVQQWLALLGSPEVAAAAQERGLTVGFLPHPNMQPLLPRLNLPPHVVALSYDGVDVQEYFARTRLLVTDYSSIAFNAAYLDRPVVYFQFDAEEVARGAHVGRPGYFSYADDGFGPVTTTHEATVSAIVAALEAGPEPTSPYRERVAEAFPDRDGQCAERVIAAVKAARTRA